MDEQVKKLGEFMGWHLGVNLWTEDWFGEDGEFAEYPADPEKNNIWNPQENITHAFMLLDRARELYIHTFERLENEVTFFWDCKIEIKRIDYKGSGRTRQLAICNAIEKLIDNQKE